jgi:transcriptional regulator with XRE-family HTH domain
MADPAVPSWLRELKAAVLAHLAAENATQVSLAVHLGVTPKHLSQVLAGGIVGSPVFIDQLATAVGLKITTVAAGESPATLAPSQRGRKRRASLHQK